MEKVKIVLSQDDTCEMEQLTVNGVVVGFGNLSDEHCEDRVRGIKKTLKILNIPFTYKYDSQWRYEDGS